MWVKLPLGDLNPNPCPPYPTNTYTCRVTIASKMCGGVIYIYIILVHLLKRNLLSLTLMSIYKYFLNCYK